MELIMFVGVRTRRLISPKNPGNLCNGKFGEQVMYVLNATVKGTGRVNVTRGPSKYGGAIIATPNLIQSNRLNAMNVHVEPVGARGELAIVTDVEGMGTGQTSVMHEFKDDKSLNFK